MGCITSKVRPTADGSVKHSSCKPHASAAAAAKSCFTPAGWSTPSTPAARRSESFSARGGSHHPGAACDGVSLLWLLTQFADSIADDDNGGGATTTADVVSQIVVPATAARRCRYIDLLDDGLKPPPHVGRAQWVVSHCWAQPFKAGLLRQLRHHFSHLSRQQLADTFAWIDIFAVNQHSGSGGGGSVRSRAGQCHGPQQPGLKEEHVLLTRTVQDAVASAREGTLLVVGERCTALTRAWCVYEAWQTAAAKGPTGLQLLVHGATDVDSLCAAVTGIDVRKAAASFDADRMQILAEAEAAAGGADAVNDLIKTALVDSAVAAAKQAAGGANASNKKDGDGSSSSGSRGTSGNANSSEDGVAAAEAAAAAADACMSDAAELAYVAGRLCWSAGRLAEAEPLLQLVVSAREADAGAAGAASAAGPDGDQAQSRAAGGRHSDVQLAHAQALADLASVQHAQGKLTEAERLHRRALGVRERAAGDHHPLTAQSLLCLAEVQDELQHDAGAEACYSRAAAILEAAARGAQQQGAAAAPGRPRDVRLVAVGSCWLGLAGLLQRRGALQEAEATLRAALGAYEEAAAGDADYHPMVATTLGNLSTVLCDSRYGTADRSGGGNGDGKGENVLQSVRTEEAEALARRALMLRQRALGADHPDTACSLSALAVLLRLRGGAEREAEARELLMCALRVRESVLGPDHALTAYTRRQLGSALPPVTSRGS